MTTLSKEDVVRMDSESGLYVYHNGDADIEQLQAFATLARADLVAENERLKSVPMKYRRMAFNAELQYENEKLRAALAAAEARERKLCKAIVLFRNEKAVGRAGSVRATEGYAAMQYAVFDQPRDDLVAENERLKRSNSSYANLTKAQEGQLTSLRLRLYELKGADKLIDSERAANATLTEEITATRTALAEKAKEEKC